MTISTTPSTPKGYQSGTLAQFTPEQLQLFKSLFSHTGPQSFLGRLAQGDEGQFQQLEAPALRQFGQLQGQLASRFSGMGSGARRSSGFNLASNEAAMDLSERLQAQRMGLQQQAIRDLMGLSNQLLGQRPYEEFLVEKPQSFWKSLLGGASAGVGSGLGQAAGLYGMKKSGFFD